MFFDAFATGQLLITMPQHPGRSSFVIALLVSLWCVASNSAATASEAYPVRPITIIVPAGAGSGPDLSARRIAAALSSSLRQAVIVDNRPGAGGILATEQAARAVPDGYTLYLGTNASMCINPAVYERLPYDAVHAFTPISMATRGYPVLLVNPRLAQTTMDQVVRFARTHPGVLTYSSPGDGSTGHLTIEMLKEIAGIDLLHVPYKEETQAMSDVIGGQVDLTVAFSAVAVGHVRSGRLRALAIAGPKRNPLLPDVPTSAEAGYPGFVVSGWIGFFAPAKTPPAILTLLEAAILAAERSDDYAAWISSMGSEAVAMPSAQFAAEMRVDCDRWSRAAAKAHVALRR